MGTWEQILIDVRVKVAGDRGAWAAHLLSVGASMCCLDLTAHICTVHQTLGVLWTLLLLIRSREVIKVNVHHAECGLHMMICGDGVCGWLGCRFVVLVAGTVVYGRGDDQHVEAHKATLHSEHPHLRWRGTDPSPLFGPVVLHTVVMSSEADLSNAFVCPH